MRDAQEFSVEKLPALGSLAFSFSIALIFEGNVHQREINRWHEAQNQH
jgi:hypothetical protein